MGRPGLRDHSNLMGLNCRSALSFPNSQALTGTPFDGMAACGGNWDGGTVQHLGVVFERAPSGVNTRQCTELAARWFYIDTGLTPKLVNYGENVASEYNGKYKQFTLSKATSTFGTSIQAGDIISMWGGKGTDPYGHVAVVTGVHVTGGTGTISVIEENGSSDGSNNHSTSPTTRCPMAPPVLTTIYTKFQWIALPAV